MKDNIYVVFVFLCIFPSLIQCQSGTFMPLIGLLDKFTYKEHDWMVNEPDCISACIQQISPSCYGITYESYRQECRLITQYFPNSTIPNQSFLNWRTYVRIIDS